MFDTPTVAVIALTFLVAGGVKGVIGLGLPSVSLGLLTATLDLTTAMVLLIVPSFVTNVWQGVTGGQFQILLKRLWPFLIMAMAAVGIGALALSRLDVSLLTKLLGGLLITYALSGLFGIRIKVPASSERWAGPLLGGINGLLTGMTGSFVVPGVMYLQAIGLSKDAFVQAMGMLFTLSTVSLAIALSEYNLLSTELSVASALAVLPAVVGMVIGQRVRRRVSAEQFRLCFYIGVLLIGVYIMVS